MLTEFSLVPWRSSVMPAGSLSHCRAFRRDAKDGWTRGCWGAAWKMWQCNKGRKQLPPAAGKPCLWKGLCKDAGSRKDVKQRAKTCCTADEGCVVKIHQLMNYPISQYRDFFKIEKWELVHFQQGCCWQPMHFQWSVISWWSHRKPIRRCKNSFIYYSEFPLAVSPFFCLRAFILKAQKLCYVVSCWCFIAPVTEA